MAKILLTGASGYIGSHTWLSFFEQGYTELIAVDDFSNSHPEIYDRLAAISGLPVKHYDISILSPELEQVFAENPGISGVIHFAAHKSVPESVEKPIDYFENNLYGLIRIMKMCDRYGVGIFVFSSSCAVYGNIDTLPVTEETPLRTPQSPYAYTKRTGEELLESWATASKKVKVVNLRYFNPAGAYMNGLLGELPGNRPANLVPVLCNNARNPEKSFTVFGTDYNTPDGSCIRDYIHVSDIADAHVAAFVYASESAEPSFFRTYNLGSESGTSVLEVIRVFGEENKVQLTYVPGPRRSGDVEAIWADCALAHRELGWKPRRSLQEIMRSAWQWTLNYAKP